MRIWKGNVVVTIPSRPKNGHPGLTKLPEPAIREGVARAVGRPTRRIHFAVGTHWDVVSLDFAAAIAEVADEFFARVELRAGGVAPVEIADQTNA